MSQGDRDSGPREDDPDGQGTGREDSSASRTAPLTGARPIEPYDPYRRRSASPFLPDDDPLSSEAWQLEIDEIAAVPDDDTAPAPEVVPDTPAPARRPRRQPSPPRGTRDASPPAARGRRDRSSAAPARTRVSRPTVTVALPRVVAGASLVADQRALLLLGINAVSILLMALILGVRIGGVPSPAVLQLDAAGGPALWGPPSVLWRLPVMAFFITLMFLAVAWFLHPIDRIAARFALGSTILMQLVAWVAVIQHLR
jgi:hypothetical protein